MQSSTATRTSQPAAAAPSLHSDGEGNEGGGLGGLGGLKGGGGLGGGLGGKSSVACRS